MDQGLAPRSTETIGLGREGNSAWWQGGPHRHTSRMVTLVAVVGLGLGTYSLVSENSVPQVHPRPTAKPVPSPHSPEQIATLRLRHMRGSKEISYSGVVLVVPQYWGRDRVTECGGLLADTVIYPGNERLSCDLSTGCCPTSKLQHSSVQFIDTVQARGDSSSSVSVIHRGLIHRGGGGYVQFIDVPGRGTRLVVRSPYESLIERLSASLRLTTSQRWSG